MALRRRQPFIWVTWLKNYLIGENLCRWSIWHRIHFDYEKAKSDFDNIRYKMDHSALLNETLNRYTSAGYEVFPELEVTVTGSIARLKGQIDLVAIREDSNLIIETKTGIPRASDKIQLMLYIWALPRSNHKRFAKVPFDGLLVYPTHEIQISAVELDETFVKHFTRFTKDILSGEPDRKYPSPRECAWCTIDDCDERMETEKEPEQGDYIPDFF